AEEWQKLVEAASRNSRPISFLEAAKPYLHCATERNADLTNHIDCIQDRTKDEFEPNSDDVNDEHDNAIGNALKTISKGVDSSDSQCESVNDYFPMEESEIDSEESDAVTTEESSFPLHFSPRKTRSSQRDNQRESSEEEEEEKSDDEDYEETEKEEEKEENE
ncbi:hypothetical protein PFISCL1PPCAC_21747, partial [Pristionchus fissidentatus]